MAFLKLLVHRQAISEHMLSDVQAIINLGLARNCPLQHEQQVRARHLCQGKNTLVLKSSSHPHLEVRFLHVWQLRVSVVSVNKLLLASTYLEW